MSYSRLICDALIKIYRRVARCILLFTFLIARVFPTECSVQQLYVLITDYTDIVCVV